MTPEELLEEWTSGDPGLRPARIQQVRDDLRTYTGLPVPRRVTAIEQWLDANRADVTSLLEEAVETEE